MAHGVIHPTANLPLDALFLPHLATVISSTHSKFFVLFTIGFLFVSCNKEVVPEEIVKVPGVIQVLNGSGLPKAAGKMRDYLVSKGFDVIEMGNASHWNHKESIIALRNPRWPGQEPLAKFLKTENVIILENPIQMVDATVIVGQNYEEVINDQKSKSP
jgi:hypothetical protein